jgi:predicted transcriptional regulator
MENQPQSDLLELTAQIVAAHVSNNAVGLPEVPSLIEQVYRTLAGLGGAAPAAAPVEEKPQPAVPVKKSVTDEYLVCLEDGRKLKLLKRYLKTAYDMTPGQYRERWGLPSDYPMAAPNYAKHRSAMAKKIGLGTKPRNRRQRQAAE